MEKEFDKWNEEKKKIASNTNPRLFPQEREIWLCVIGKNIGREQNGGDYFSRPILIIKKFNNEIFWVVPLSTKQKKYDFFYNFTDVNGEPASAILAQLRLVSVKRFIRKLYDFQADDFNKIIISMVEFLKNRNPS